MATSKLLKAPFVDPVTTKRLAGPLERATLSKMLLTDTHWMAITDVPGDTRAPVDRSPEVATLVPTTVTVRLPVTG